MKPGGAIICPSCGTKNKPKWEFCVSCSESLKGVPAVAESKASLAPPAREVERAGSGLSWLTLLVGVGLIVAAYFFLRGYRSQPAAADGTSFTLPTTTRGETATRAAPTRLDAGSSSPANLQLSQGEALLARGDAAGALPLLAEAVASLPGSGKAHYLYASALWQTGSKDEAVAQYREAAQAESGNRLYRAELGKALTALGQPQEAAEVYEAILADEPNSPGVLRDLAALQAQSGNRERWVQLLAQAVELEPNSAVLRQDLAYALEKSGRTSEAIEAYRTVVALEPKAAASRGLLADLLFRQGSRDEAIALAQEGVQLDPQAARPHRDLGSLLERMGRVQDAVAEYREYARLAPTSPDARQLAARAERLARDSGGT
jgi:Flp pilus assembly protein TadD